MMCLNVGAFELEVKISCLRSNDNEMIDKNWLLTGLREQLNDKIMMITSFLFHLNNNIISSCVTH